MAKKPIYELISENIQDGVLNKEFSLPKEESNHVPFADGAMDGISVYHMGASDLNEEERMFIENAIRFASNGETKSADVVFQDICKKHRVIGIIDEIQRYVIDHASELNAGNLYQYALYLILTSSEVECVKVGMVLLELFKVDDSIKEVIRTLSLSDEFTVFGAFLMRSWENGQMEILNAAKSVSGWGRIHTVELIQPETEEIRQWLLKEGVNNSVLPAYSGLECYTKTDVEHFLDQDEISYEEIHAILAIIDAILDEGPVPGISTLEEPIEILIKVLKHAKKLMPLQIEDYEVIHNISKWQEDNGEEENSVMNELIHAIFSHESCRECVKDYIKSGRTIDLAIKLGIAYEEELFSAMIDDFDHTYHACHYLMDNPFYANRVVQLFRENTPLEKMKTGPGKEMGLGKDFIQVNKLDYILTELRKHVGVGEDIVAIAMQTPYIRSRNGAIKVMQDWVNASKKPLVEVSSVLYDVLMQMKEQEVEDYILNNIIGLLDGKIAFDDQN